MIRVIALEAPLSKAWSTQSPADAVSLKAGPYYSLPQHPPDPLSMSCLTLGPPPVLASQAADILVMTGRWSQQGDRSRLCP